MAQAAAAIDLCVANHEHARVKVGGVEDRRNSNLPRLLCFGVCMRHLLHAIVIATDLQPKHAHGRPLILASVPGLGTVSVRRGKEPEPRERAARLISAPFVDGTIAKSPRSRENRHALTHK